MTFLWRARAVTPRLTRGMCNLRSGERQHRLHGGDVRFMDGSRTAQLAFVLRGFLGQDVTLESLAALDGTTAAHLEALGSAFFALHLGHDDTLLAWQTQVTRDPGACQTWHSQSFGSGMRNLHARIPLLPCLPRAVLPGRPCKPGKASSQKGDPSGEANPKEIGKSP